MLISKVSNTVFLQIVCINPKLYCLQQQLFPVCSVGSRSGPIHAMLRHSHETCLFSNNWMMKIMITSYLTEGEYLLIKGLVRSVSTDVIECLVP